MDTDVVGNYLGSSTVRLLHDVNASNICTLILLQTDSSPSLSLAQLTKVPFLDLPAKLPENIPPVHLFFRPLNILFSPPSLPSCVLDC